MLLAARDDLEELHGDPLAIWRAWAPGVTGGTLESVRHVAEEAPGELALALIDFLLAENRTTS